MIRAVVDTNALASGIIGTLLETSVPGHILRAWRAGAFALVVSEPILHELARTLHKPYFRRRLREAQLTAVLRLLREEAVVQALTVTVAGIATHPEDDCILATALSGHADYLVTGDRKLQDLEEYQGVRILSPRQFLALLIQMEEES